MRDAKLYSIWQIQKMRKTFSCRENCTRSKIWALFLQHPCMITAAAAPGIERLIFSQKRSGIQYCNILELSKLLEITTFRIPEPETKEELALVHPLYKTTDTRIIHDLCGKQGGRRGCHLPANKKLQRLLCNKPLSTYIKKESTEICRVGPQIWHRRKKFAATYPRRLAAAAARCFPSSSSSSSSSSDAQKSPL